MKQKVKLDEYDKEELRRAVNDMNNPFYFESYCGACNFFSTEECRFRDKVLADTEWKYIPCNKFYD